MSGRFFYAKKQKVYHEGHRLRCCICGIGGGVVIKKHPGMLCRIPVADPFELADADTPETLELLKGLCHD